MTDGMNRAMKAGLVLGGYVLAFLTSSVAVALYDRRFTPADNQAYGGMIAGGEMMYGVAVFVLAALVPTGLALWFVRRHRPTWSIVSWLCIAYAVVGLVAVLTLKALTVARAGGPLIVLVDLLGLVQMLGSPLWIAAFALFAALAPTLDLRRRMLVVVAIEVVIGGCGLVHFLVPASPV